MVWFINRANNRNLCKPPLAKRPDLSIRPLRETLVSPQLGPKSRLSIRKTRGCFDGSGFYANISVFRPAGVVFARLPILSSGSSTSGFAAIDDHLDKQQLRLTTSEPASSCSFPDTGFL